MTTMSSVQTPLQHRNAQICAMHKSGASYHHIAHTYNLSVEAVRGICLKDQFLSQREQRKQSHSELMEDTDLYILMVEQNRFQRTHGELSAVPLQAYNRVRQFWKERGNNGFPTIDFFMHLPLEEFASMRNVGKSILSFVATVQENYRTQRRR